MPNLSEEELRAYNCTIAEITRKMEECVNVKHYDYLNHKKQEIITKRDELLKKMGVGEYE